MKQRAHFHNVFELLGKLSLVFEVSQLLFRHHILKELITGSVLRCEARSLVKKKHTVLILDRVRPCGS